MLFAWTSIFKEKAIDMGGEKKNLVNSQIKRANEKLEMKKKKVYIENEEHWA